MTYVKKFNEFTGTLQTVNDYRAADTYSVWYWLTIALWDAATLIGDTNYYMPAYWRQLWADAVDNQYWQNAAFISIPVGYKAVVSGFQALVTNGENNYFDNVRLLIWLHSSATPPARDAYFILTTAQPFGTTAGPKYYYTTSLTNPPDMYNRTDSTTNILSEIGIRYQVNKSGVSGEANLLFNHAFKIDYTKL